MKWGYFNSYSRAKESEPYEQEENQRQHERQQYDKHDQFHVDRAPASGRLHEEILAGETDTTLSMSERAMFRQLKVHGSRR